jgi:urease accessory protein
MPEANVLFRLMAMLSPAFPVGSFSYSGGLEPAVDANAVTDAATLEDWIATLLAHGSAWNDAVLLAAAWRASGDAGRLAEIAELAEALAGSAERHRETMLQGAAFLAAARNWQGLVMPDLSEAPYPVAIGAVAGAASLPLPDVLAAYSQAFASNMLQASIRLGVIGQNDAVALIARLEPAILETVSRAAVFDLDDLGSATIVADIFSMHHETQYSRLFRS